MSQKEELIPSVSDQDIYVFFRHADHCLASAILKINSGRCSILNEHESRPVMIFTFRTAIPNGKCDQIRKMRNDDA